MICQLKNALLKFFAMIFCCLHFQNLPAQIEKKSEIFLVKAEEPGKPFSLTIQILDIHSKKPVTDAEVLVYQTNHKGDYEATPGRKARISGTAFSDASGNITFHTIYPRGYNDSPTGEHIHFQLKASNYERQNSDLIFADHYRKRYDFNNPVTYKVYLKSLEEKNGRLFGHAMIYMKKQ